MTTKVKSLLEQLRDAANAIKTNIQDMDDQIAALVDRRRALTDAPVSKTDLMNFLRADIERRASGYQIRIEKWARESGYPLSFIHLERNHLAGKNQPFPYLDGNPAHDDFNFLEPAGLYWNFGDLILERFAIALDKLGYGNFEMPVAERRAKIAEIDKQLKALNTERDKLAAELIDSGMYE